MPKILGVTWPKPRPFWGKLFKRPLGFPKTKLRTKFEVSSWSSYEDMFNRMPKIIGVTWPKPRPQGCRGYGESHGDSHGYGYGMGMGTVMNPHGTVGNRSGFLNGCNFHLLHRVAKKTSKIIFVITTSNFHQIRQFLAQRWQIV